MKKTKMIKMNYLKLKKTIIHNYINMKLIK